MAGEGRTLHPYDLLASPKRRKIMRVLEKGPLTYSQVMEKTGIDDSGKLSYHLGVLAHYIDHKDNLYSLSFEGEILSRAAKEFEKKTYGVMGQILLSGEVDAKGLLKLNGTFDISVTLPTGGAVKFDPRTIDHAKVDAALRSRMDKVLPQSQLRDLSFDFEDGRIGISLETRTQAYQERDGWLVGKSGADLVSEGTAQEKALPLPGMHFRGAGTILFPEGAEIQRIFSDRKKLEEAGLEIYELTADGLNLRWRVRRGDVLYLGETRTEGGTRPREVFESEFHVSPREPPEPWGETRERIVDLPGLVTGETRFRVRPTGFSE